MPTGTLPLKLGRLNVVDQSQTPYRVEVIANRAEYVVLETAVPSHKNQEAGAEVPDHILISPVIVVVGATLVHCASHIAETVL